MADVEFDCPQLTKLSEAFAELAALLKDDLMGANEAILMRAEMDLQRLYGDRLAKYWDDQIVAPGTGELAHLNFSGNDVRLRGYEFGTRRHFIRADQSGRPYLRFIWHGAWVVYAWVDHPGTQGHNLSGEFVSDLSQYCEEEWSAGLGALLTVDRL